jgi:Zn-dependent alcohol dehydrogenase
MTMKTQAAILRKPGDWWEMAELDLDPPGTGEVLVRFMAAGLCHSDEHIRAGFPARLPMVGGHEGAGIVEAVGPGVTRVAEMRLEGNILIGYQRRLQGALFGGANPLHDIPKILGLYRSGDIKLDQLVSRRYRLDQVNDGYRDMLDGKNIRGVIIHEH